MLTKRQAQEVKILQPPKDKKRPGEGLSPIDTALFEKVQAMCTAAMCTAASAVSPAELQLLKQLVLEGASVANSGVLHMAAVFSWVPGFEALLFIAPNRAEAINAREPAGNTPLHLAAAMAPGRCLMEADVPTTFCALLLGYGADKSAKNAQGLTALGRARGAMRCSNDFARTFGKKGHDCTALYDLLRPAEGPSIADDAALDFELSKQGEMQFWLDRLAEMGEEEGDEEAQSESDESGAEDD